MESKRINPTTWHFEWGVSTATKSSQDVSSLFRTKLEAAQNQRNIRSLQVVCFSCKKCDDGDLVIISGFVHCKEPVRDVTIRAWSAVWTQGDENCLAPFPKEGPNTIRWTACALGPGQTWRDHDDIKKFLSDDTRVREDWGPVPSTAPVNKGGRPRKHPTTAGAAGAAATPAAASTAPSAPPSAPPGGEGYTQATLPTAAAVRKPRRGRPPEGVDAAAAATTTAADQERAAAAKVLQSRQVVLLRAMLQDLRVDPARYLDGDKKGVIEALLGKIGSAAVLGAAANASAARGRAPTAAAVLVARRTPCPSAGGLAAPVAARPGIAAAAATTAASGASIPGASPPASSAPGALPVGAASDAAKAQVAQPGPELADLEGLRVAARHVSGYRANAARALAEPPRAADRVRSSIATGPSSGGAAAPLQTRVPLRAVQAPASGALCGLPPAGKFSPPPAPTTAPPAPSKLPPPQPGAGTAPLAAAGAEEWASNRLARMLHGEPWPEGAVFASATDMIDADLEHLFHSLGLGATPSVADQKRFCALVLKAMPPTRDESVHSLKVLETLLHGTMISTTVSTWLLGLFAGYCGFTPGKAGCEGADTTAARKCRLHVDRVACRDKVVFDVELFNNVADDGKAAILRAKEAAEGKTPQEQRRFDITGNDCVEMKQQAAAPIPSSLTPPPPAVMRRLKYCWKALQEGAQLSYLQLTSLHASAGVIDTRPRGASGGPGQAVCHRLCSLGWPLLADEKYFIDHITGLLKMDVRYEDSMTAGQIWLDCVLRGTFAQIEFVLGTVGGTSSPDADPLMVHGQMQRARTWSIFRAFQEAHELWPDQNKPLLETLLAAVKELKIPATIAALQPALRQPAPLPTTTTSTAVRPAAAAVPTSTPSGEAFANTARAAPTPPAAAPGLLSVESPANAVNTDSKVLFAS